MLLAPPDGFILFCFDTIKPKGSKCYKATLVFYDSSYYWINGGIHNYMKIPRKNIKGKPSFWLFHDPAL
jgi:hypothetical protein